MKKEIDIYKIWKVRLRKNNDINMYDNVDDILDNSDDFGEILVTSWRYGIFGTVTVKELITGKKIPVLCLTGPDDAGETLLSLPNKPYYINMLNEYPNPTIEEVKEYLEQDYIDFRNRIENFIFEKKEKTYVKSRKK